MAASPTDVQSFIEWVNATTLITFGTFVGRLRYVVQCQAQQKNGTADDEKRAQAIPLRKVRQRQRKNIDRQRHCKEKEQHS